jgi:hypothetical protein
MKAPDKAKPLFAPVPLRALGDRRFTGLHFRALGVIGWHARLAGSCWAATRTIAETIGGNYSNVKTVIRDLVAWGYLECHVSPSHKNRRIYYIIHDYCIPAGKPWSGEAIGKPIGQTHRVPIGTRWRSNGCPQKQQVAENEKQFSDKRFCKTEEEETLEKCASFASECRAPSRITSALAIFEQRLKSGKCSEEEFEQGISLCNAIINTQPFQDPEIDWPTWYWANRLLGEYEPQPEDVGLSLR